MTEPDVSIVMPLRDGVLHLSECLHSIHAQSLHNFELIVVDDGSRDSGPQLVQQFADGDSRIRLVRRSASGIVSALNDGLRIARSDFVARMDADDIMHPQRLELQYELMRHRPELTLLACCVDAFPDSSMGAGMREYMRWQNSCVYEKQLHEQRYVESVFAHPSVMFRRDRIVALGGYRDGTFPEDYELWLRIAEAGDPMAKLEQVLLRWRQDGNSLSRRDERYSRTAFDILRARYLARDPCLDPARPLVVWGAGRRTRQRCERLFAHGHRVSAWIDIDPHKIGRRYANASVQSCEWLAQRFVPAERPYVLVYVTNHGAREEIGDQLESLNFRAGGDYLMVG